MAAKLWIPLLLFVQVMSTVRTQNKIEPIAPIAGTERSPLNITCMVTITSDLEGVRLKKLGAGGQDATLVQLIAPDYKLNDDFDTTKYTFVNIGLPSFTVTIKEAMFVDAERYRCELIVENNINQVTSVVIMRQPTIQVLSQIRAGDTTKMSCDVEYDVPYDLDGTNEADMFPKLVATIGGVEQSGAVVERTTGKLAMSWNATLGAADDKKDLICKATTDATPHYEISTTEALNVLYDVQNIVLAPQQESYYVGDMINCTAQGNPAPSIKWNALSSKTPGNNVGSVLTIIETMVGETKESWKCEATNTLSGKKIEVIIEFAVVKPTDPPPGEKKETHTAAIAAGVTVPLILIILAVVVVVVVILRKKKKPPQKPVSTEGNVNPATFSDPEDGKPNNKMTAYQSEKPTPAVREQIPNKNEHNVSFQTSREEDDPNVEKSAELARRALTPPPYDDGYTPPNNDYHNDQGKQRLKDLADQAAVQDGRPSMRHHPPRGPSPDDYDYPTSGPLAPDSQPPRGPPPTGYQPPRGPHPQPPRGPPPSDYPDVAAAHPGLQNVYSMPKPKFVQRPPTDTTV